MSTAVISHRLEFHSLADAALKAATRFWFGVAVIGQSIFFFAVASFYGHYGRARELAGVE